MSQPVSLKNVRISGGVYSAMIVGLPKNDRIEVLHEGQPVEGLTTTQTDAGPVLSLPLPAGLLGDGVTTFVIRVVGETDPIGHFTILAGEPLAEDIRAEVALLRAELDLLKAAFRQHVRG